MITVETAKRFTKIARIAEEEKFTLYVNKLLDEISEAIKEKATLGEDTVKWIFPDDISYIGARNRRTEIANKVREYGFDVVSVEYREEPYLLIKW